MVKFWIYHVWLHIGGGFLGSITPATSIIRMSFLWLSCSGNTVINTPFINKEVPIRGMSTKTILAILVIAAISLTAMGSTSAIGVVSTAFAQNMTANATDTSNMTTFEENATASEIDTSGASMSG